MKPAGYLITLSVVLILNFFIPRLMPGDPFTFLSSDPDGVTIVYTPEQIEKFKGYYGMDKPLTEQFISYFSNLVSGDIGYSIYYNDDVIDVIASRALWTISLVIISLSLAGIAGIITGAISAWFRDHLIDRSLYSFMILFSEIPAFITAIILLFAGGAWLGWFPLSGGATPFRGYTSGWDKISDIVMHAVLPVTALVFARLGEFYLLARSSMITVLSKDYIRTAKGKGLLKRRIIFIHALKNAAPPVVTRIFISLGTVFGGAILVENVFRYPGAGFLLREAVLVRDYPLIQGLFLFVAVSVLIMNFTADMLYGKFDPRVRVS